MPENEAWSNLKSTLVVDDSATMRELVAATVRRQGLDTEICDGAPQALTLCAVRSFDIIFLDIEMPGMDGFQLAEALRALPMTKHSYIVAVTAKSVNKEFIQRCVQSGINDCIVKPMKEDVLRKRLACWGPLKKAGKLINGGAA